MFDVQRSLIRTALLSGAAVVPGVGWAADMGVFKAAPAPVDYRPWYIQVETGAAIFNDPSSVNPGVVYGCPPINCGARGSSYSETLFGGGGPMVGARFGYQWTPMWRFDVSVQYMTHTLTGNIDYNVPTVGNSCNPATSPGNCSLNSTRKASSLVE